MVGFIASILGLVGWFGFKSLLVLGVATAIYVLELLKKWKELNQGARVLILVWAVIGGIVSTFLKTPFYIGSMVAWNIESLVSTIPAVIMFFKLMFK